MAWWDGNSSLILSIHAREPSAVNPGANGWSAVRRRGELVGCLAIQRSYRQFNVFECSLQVMHMSIEGGVLLATLMQK